MIGGLGQRVLMQRAYDYVQRYRPQLIGITGSWGLALTKHALEIALRDYTTLRISADGAASISDVALGITGGRQKGRGWVRMLGLGRITEAVHAEPKTILVEVPVSKPGQVDAVAQKLPFSIVVATNVHTGRLAYFTRKEFAAHEVLSLPASLSQNGIVVLNVDEPLLAAAAGSLQAHVIGYGVTPAADVRISRLEIVPGEGATIELRADNRFFEGRLPHIVTRMQAHAVVGALAGAYAATNDAHVIQAGLAHMQSAVFPMGYGVEQIIHDQTILADTFDATPESMEADLRALTSMHGRKIAVLGDVIDLGGKSTAWHAKIGEQAAESADVAIFVGEHMREAQVAALTGNHHVDTHHFESSRDVGTWLKDYIHSGDTILITGSYETHIEKVLSQLEKVL